MSEAVLNQQPTAAPAAAPAAAPVAAPAAAPAVAWLPDADPDTAGFIQTKAWASPKDAVTSYRELEKFVGADRAGRGLVLPADPASPEWDNVWTKLGRPPNPDAYGIKAPEGQSPEFAKAASAWMHKAGLNTQQAQTLSGLWNEHQAQLIASEQAALEAALGQEHEALAKDWGSKDSPSYGVQRELARRAAQSLGLDEEAITALESVVGFSKVMKAFAKLGKGLSEHGAEGLDAGGTFAMTPEAARSKRSQLIADKDWRSRAMVTGSAEWSELVKLDKIIAAHASA